MSTRSDIQALALAACLALPGAVFTQSLPEDLDAYIEDVRSEWRVAGLSISVVKDGAVVYAKGFGDRERGSGLAVDEHTLFAIGSNTKAFTAAGLGILVDDGKLSWDDRVIDHLPWFRLKEPYVTREITVRDILSHRSGLGRRGDSNWYASDFDREEIVRRIRHLEPNSSFRSQAGYQNTMFLTAGLVIEAVTGESWDTWIKHRILQPLGMTRSRTSVLELEGMDNVATPHAILDDEVVVVPHRNIDNIGPAGSILSSALEMTYWMRAMLGEGAFEETRIVSENVVSEVWKSNIIYPLPPSYTKLFPSTHFSTYGLGWGLRDYRGRLVATHTGGIDGMLSQILLLPEEELGIVVLTNTSPSGSLAQSTVTFHIVDAYLGASGETDWRAAFRELGESQKKQQVETRQKRDASRVADTTPTLALDAYAGKYEDTMYGALSFSIKGDALVLRRHSDWIADLEHWHFDTFLARWRDPVMGESLVSFRIAANGKVSSVDVEGLAEFERQ
ncbi:MAG: serine hydrolase [Acidobacteria bacterium]|nr:MAG: serine hydrolase [Acidobacteriota bacterium]